MLARAEVVAPPFKKQLVRDFGQCRTVAKGCQILRCESCRRSAVYYNACNRRGCPICGPKNQVAWLESAKRRLIPVGHIHLVFSFPDELTRRWRESPRPTIGQMFRAVNKAIGVLETQQGVRTGRMLVFQSHGKGMSYKAHIHCLMTDGGLNQDRQWQKLGTLPLERMAERLKLEYQLESEKGLRIHQSRHEKSGEAVVRYLGQRQFGQVVKCNELTQEDGEIRIEHRGGETRLDRETFVERYLNHIPEKGTVMVRHYGLYSNREVKLRSRAIEILDVKEMEPRRAWKPECPRCRTALMVMGVWAAYQPRSFERWGLGVGPPEHQRMGEVY